MLGLSTALQPQTSPGGNLPHALRVSALVLACAVSACGDADPKPPAAPSSSQAPSPPVAAPKPAQSERAKRTLAREDLQRLLDSWLAAQNSGEFAAYEALYAPGMRGVKRVGERETRMDRAQWMTDRARMFRKKMEVEVHSVTFRSLTAMAVIELVQVFHSGKFTDSGPKKLIVMLDDGTPRIVQEEMLSSQVLTQAAELAERAHLAFRAGEASYVVLQQQAEPSWGQGDFSVEGALEDDVSAYMQAVTTTLVPRASEWLGMALRVYDDDGTECSATVTELKIALLGTQYHLSEEEHERIGKLEGDKAIDARARAVLSHEPAMLVGKLSACSGMIATPASQPAPALYVSFDLDPETEQAAIAATRALPKYRALQAEWEVIWKRVFMDEAKPGEQPGDWGGEAGVASFGSPDGQRFVFVGFGNDGCESEMPELLVALYRIDAQGALSLKRISSTWAGASLLIDLNADEMPEAVGNRELRGFGEYGSFLIQEVREAYNGCTC